MSEPQSESGQFPSRRDWLRTAAASTAALAAGGLVTDRLRDADGAENVATDHADGSTELIVRSSRPLDLESPVQAFDQFLTPNHSFFVRSHFGAPVVDPSDWRLEIVGLVEKPLTLALRDLAGFRQVRMPAVLQCAGNGRAFFDPTIPGVPWEKGAVGNAEWTGVRLIDVLAGAGVNTDTPGLHLHLHGADLPPSPKTPAYLRSVPLLQVLRRDAILATRMNGEPLPVTHGGPVRLVVPGWTANHWVKWLRKINVATEEAPGFYQQTGYKMPKHPVPPGVDIKPADLVPVTGMTVKSLIARPMAGAKVAAQTGKIAIQGVAWTGPDAVVERLEIARSAEGPWQSALYHARAARDLATLDGRDQPRR